MAETIEKCFVIMPFSKTKITYTKKYWTSHFEYLKTLIENNTKLSVHRSEPLGEDILNVIIKDLIYSRIVVADLTHHNSNVFWELGIRHSFASGTIMIAEKDTKLPFDISKHPIIFYSKKPGEDKEFKKSFKKALEDCLNNPKRPDSPVLYALTGRGTIYEIIHREETKRRLNGLISECKYNLEKINSFIIRAEINQDKTQKRYIPYVRFRLIAFELLIANRYLDEDEQFYEKAKILVHVIADLEEFLRDWKSYPDQTEKGLIRNKRFYTEAISDFGREIDTARDKIINKL